MNLNNATVKELLLHICDEQRRVHHVLRETNLKLEEMREELVTLRTGEPQTTKAKPEDEIVDAAYVARLFHCVVSSVREGKAGTRHVRWLSRRPLKCTRVEAHAALRRYEDASHQTKRIVPSLIRRKPRKHHPQAAPQTPHAAAHGAQDEPERERRPTVATDSIEGD